jgi:hypothetical protein
METIKQGSFELEDMLKRLNSYYEKFIKIKLFDGTIIEGKLSKLNPKVYFEKQLNGKSEAVSESNINAFYLKVENGTLIISALEISNFEPTV